MHHLLFQKVKCDCIHSGQYVGDCGCGCGHSDMCVEWFDTGDMNSMCFYAWYGIMLIFYIYRAGMCDIYVFMTMYLFFVRYDVEKYVVFTKHAKCFYVWNYILIIYVYTVLTGVICSVCASVCVTLYRSALYFMCFCV